MTGKEFPQYEEKIAVRIGDLIYNPRRIGPTTLAKLRSSNYGDGLGMGTLPELTPFVHSAVMNRENEDYQTLQNIVETLKDYWITGDTRPLWTPKGLWVIDHFTDEETETELEKLLGTKEEHGVIFSPDRKIRFAPSIYEAPVEYLKSHKVLATHPGVIAIFGGEENAELIAEISAKHKSDPYFGGFSAPVKEPIRLVAVLGSDVFVGSLGVGGSFWVGGGLRCSFGVRRAPMGANVSAD